jgi:hypothetical protein
MDNMTQTSNQEITSFLEVKNKVKYSPNILDKASRIFETNVGQKYGYRIIKIIDVDGLRIVMAEDSNRDLYAISLVIIQGGHNDNANNQLTLSDIGRITKHIAKQYEAIASSSFIEID